LSEQITRHTGNSEGSGFAIIATHDVRRLCSIANRVVVLKERAVANDIRGQFSEEEILSLYIEANT